MVTLLVLCSLGQTPDILNVEASPITPLVFEDGTGFAIDIWKEVCTELGISHEIRMRSFDPTFNSIRNGDADVIIGGITITDNREASVDFTQPFMRSGLRIAVNADNLSAPSFVSTWGRPEILKVIMAFIGLLLIAGGFLWLLEHRKGNVKTLSDGIHLAQASASTQGFGDKYPVTNVGRVVVALLFFVGAGAITDIQSTLASIKTAERLSSTINGPGDLVDKNVGVKAGTTSAVLVRKISGPTTEFKTIEEAYESLSAGKIDAVVFDSPSILYECNNNDRIVTVGEEFAPQEYGFVFPQGHPMVESVSRAILRLKENGGYDKLYDKWFGK